ncbi:retrovirus-related pol polyprotein from transposon TNT 1-94 [Tanacetum coccineum]
MINVWKPTGKVFREIGYSWKPTGRTFTVVKNKCPLTRITSTKEEPLKETTIILVITQSLALKVNSRKLKASRSVGSSSKAKIVESKTSNTKGPKQSWGSTVFDVPSSSLIDCRLSKLFYGTVRFGNDHIAKIIGYGDYQIGSVIISRLYYVEGLGHNLFSVGQFCDSDLEVAFRKHTYFIRDLDGVDILKGSRGLNLYTLSMDNLLLSFPICLLSKASKTKSWLWRRRLSHLNFDYITSLTKQGLVREFVIKFLKMIQVCLNATVRNVRTDNGTEFVNQTLKAYYKEVGISHQTSVARTPQLNGVVERRNRTLVEAAHTMLIFSKDLLFIWAEAVMTACYTQNQLLIRKCHNKTPYELLYDSNLTYPIFMSLVLFSIPLMTVKTLLTSMAYGQFSSGPKPKLMTLGTISSGLVSNFPSSTPYVPQMKNDWEILFQLMFQPILNKLPTFV